MYHGERLNAWTHLVGALLSISGASVLSSTSRAEGFVVVAADSEGFPEGSQVQVWLYG